MRISIEKQFLTIEKEKIFSFIAIIKIIRQSSDIYLFYFMTNKGIVLE